MKDVYCVKLFGLKKNSYYETMKVYSSFLKKHYGTNVAVRFNGHLSHLVQGAQNLSTRFLKIDTCTNIMVERNLIIQFEQSKFFRNENNKNQLLGLCKNEFRQCGIQV